MYFGVLDRGFSVFIIVLQIFEIMNLLMSSCSYVKSTQTKPYHRLSIKVNTW